MFETFRTIIEAGGFDLADITNRIKTLFATGDLTGDEMESLLDLAREKARPEDSYAPLADRVTAVETWMRSVDAWKAQADERLARLESGVGGAGSGGGSTPVDEWPEYVQPTGAHDAYHSGDHVTYDGRHYECLTDGCVWTPDDYPSGWRLVEDDETEDADSGAGEEE